MKKTRLLVLLICSLVLALAPASAPAARWSEAKANDWYARQPWLVGSNYIPATAINELEMWQADTFDPKTIDKELGWAEDLGMTTMRVFLHDLPWQQDAAGYRGRINQFLDIAARHHIRPLFVLFDSCWDPYPKLGRQPDPKPGAQFRIAAKAGSADAAGPGGVPAARSLCHRRGAGVRQGPARARVG